MRPSAQLRAAAPPAGPHKTRRNHKPLDGSNHAGCMPPARAATRRSNRDILGATKLVKIAARLPELCGDGLWFRPSSLAADPSGSGRSAATLGVSPASAPCQALLRIPLGLGTRGEREKLAAASAVQFLRVALRVQCSGLRPGCVHQRCYAQQHRPQGLTRQDAITSLWTAAIVLGVCHQPERPRGAAIATLSDLPSSSRLRPGCSNRAAMGLGLDHRVWLLIHLEAGAAVLRLAFRPHRHLVRRCYGYRWGLLRDASGKNWPQPQRCSFSA
jgi:hypothetical protein